MAEKVGKDCQSGRLEWGDTPCVLQDNHAAKSIDDSKSHFS